MRVWFAIASLAGMLAIAGGVRLFAAPAVSWTIRTTVVDCSGAGQQGAPACSSYANDVYENIDYSVAQPGTADIQAGNFGFDANYFYFEWDFVSAWNSAYSGGHQVVIEFDINPDTEFERGDFFVGLFQKSEFNSTTWIDAHSSGGYEMYEDSNNDVGGANPLVSEFGANPGDGYNAAVAPGPDRVWARIVGGNFQVAMRRTLMGNPAHTRFRIWTRQSTSLDKGKLYFHDENAITDVHQIDNTAGLGPSTWSLIDTLAADVRTTKTGATNVAASANLTYTITATNLGPSVASNVVVRDLLPPNSTFVSASGGGVYSAISGMVTWPAMNTVATNAVINFTLAVQAPAGGSMTNRASSTAGTSDPNPSNNNGTAPGAIVITTVSGGGPTGVSVSGFAYLDANRNAVRDGAEAGTGLSLFAKIFAMTNASGPALRAAVVDPNSGAYTFTNVAANTYFIILDNNSTLSDVTPTIPPGWIGTEQPGQIRSNVVVSTTSVANQNFGLANVMPIAGRIFVDNGAGGGIANDGARNGGEPGLAGVTVRLTDNSGATVYDTASSDAAGGYVLLIPATLGNGTQLKVVETNPANHLSTGASPGTSGGTYDRNTDTLTFTLTLGATYTNIDFGDVPANSFVPDNQQSGLPGTFVVYPHTYTAGTVGSLTFSVSSAPNPNISGWTQVIYRDANCNAQIDGGDPVLNAAINVATGESICILVRDFIPVNAPFNAQNQVIVTAAFAYTAASPALATNLTRTDLTTVGNPTTAGLTLVKTVDKATAVPGETLTYMVTYSNTSSEPLNNIVIFDSTPAFTTFLSAPVPQLPPNLTGVNITAPAVGASGAIQWTFTGTLAPSQTAAVTFSITVAP